jgi:hypothetical protein
MSFAILGFDPIKSKYEISALSGLWTAYNFQLV